MTAVAEAPDRETFDPNLIGRCPHPNKQGFQNRQLAEGYLIETGWLDQCPYQCACGAWHNGHPIPAARNEAYYDLQARIRDANTGGVVTFRDGQRRARPGTPRHSLAG